MSDDLGTRGISEGVSLATLVLLTIVVTASVGVSVLFLGEGSSNELEANFSFNYQGEGGFLLVTHESGDEFQSGRIRIEGPDASVTWAEAAGWNESRKVTRGDIVQLSQSSAYGSRVGSSDYIKVVYVYQNDSTKVLDEWNSDQAPGGLG